jgi:hypothetical protein
MTFVLLHRWGKSERSSDPRALEPLLAELDSPELDREHVSVAIRLPNGWSLSAFVSGLVVYENVEDLVVEPRNIRAQSRDEAKKLLNLLVAEKLSELERQPWEAGNSRSVT